MDELPSSWAVTKLREIVNILDSRRIPINSEERQARIKGKDVSELFPYFGATGQVGHIDDFLFNEPLILLGEDGVPFLDSQKSKAYRVSGKTWVNNHAHVLSVIDDLTNDIFISSYLNHFDYEGFVTGTTRLKLTQAAMNEIPVPLPPLLEQKRIADKLERLLSRVDAARERLERVPGMLKRFRASVLEQAVSGELTREWRGGDEADVSWQSVKISDVGKMGRGKSKHRPRNDSSLYGGKYPFVQTGDIAQAREYIVSHSQTYNEIGLNQSMLWPTGTVCITIAANIADTAILSYPACFPDSVVGIIVDVNKSIPKYVKWLIDVIKSDLESFAPATAQKNINLGILEDITLNIPPLAEQFEIVRRVEQLFTLADQLEAHYQSAKAQLERLTPALLAKAFRGELVEQDPTDEPASVLLERIRVERAVTGKKVLERKPRVSKEKAGTGETAKARGRPTKARENDVEEVKIGVIPRASSVEDAVKLLERKREEREAVGTVQGGLFD